MLESTQKTTVADNQQSPELAVLSKEFNDVICSFELFEARFKKFKAIESGPVKLLNTQHFTNGQLAESIKDYAAEFYYLRTEFDNAIYAFDLFEALLNKIKPVEPEKESADNPKGDANLYTKEVAIAKRLGKVIEELNAIMPNLKMSRRNELKGALNDLANATSGAVDELFYQKKCPFVNDCLLCMKFAVEGHLRKAERLTPTRCNDLFDDCITAKKITI